MINNVNHFKLVLFAGKFLIFSVTPAKKSIWIRLLFFSSCLSRWLREEQCDEAGQGVVLRLECRRRWDPVKLSVWKLFSVLVAAQDFDEEGFDERFLDSRKPCDGNCYGAARCMISGDQSFCQCPPGYKGLLRFVGEDWAVSGEYCDENDFCGLMDPCENGTCMSTQSGYYACDCAPGFKVSLTLAPLQF